MFRSSSRSYWVRSKVSILLLILGPLIMILGFIFKAPYGKFSPSPPTFNFYSFICRLQEHLVLRSEQKIGMGTDGVSRARFGSCELPLAK